MQAHLLQPEKKLRFTEKYFTGFWVQVKTLIRRNEGADALLDGILRNPMLTIIDIMADNTDGHHGHAQTVLQLYVQQNLGDPPGTYADAEQLECDPIGAIRDFSLATNAGTTGGVNPANGRNWIQSRAWAAALQRQNIIFRNACKHIWETLVGTFTSSEAVTLIAGLPYGSGPALLLQVKNMQQRQTNMALLTLFSELINIQLSGNKGIAEMYGRILQIRARLSNWDPPIILPDQLLMMCMLRLLPRTYHATRTIIMSSRETIVLKIAKDMLLDAENRDAERVAEAVGSSKTPRPQPSATALVTYEPPQRRKPKFKKKQKQKRPHTEPKKTSKYHSEGACSYHGTRGGHASSECYVLHPELKPVQRSTASVADAEALAIATIPASAPSPKPYGFLNNDWGYALVGSSEEVNSAEESGEEVNSAGEQLCVLVVDLRRGVYGVGKHQGCLSMPFGVYGGRPTCYPGGIQAGGHPLAHVVSRLVDTRDYDRIILRGIYSAGTRTKLMVPRAIADGFKTPLAYDVRGVHLKVCHLVSLVPPQEMLERACVSNDTLQPTVDSVQPFGQQLECARMIKWLMQVAKISREKILLSVRKIENHEWLETALLSMHNVMEDAG